MATGNWPALADLLKVDLAKLFVETHMSGSFGHLGRLMPLSYFPEPSIPYNNRQTSPAEWAAPTIKAVIPRHGRERKPDRQVILIDTSRLSKQPKRDLDLE